MKPPQSLLSREAKLAARITPLQKELDEVRAAIAALGGVPEPIRPTLAGEKPESPAAATATDSAGEDIANIAAVKDDAPPAMLRRKHDA